MDFRERVFDPEETLRMALEGMAGRMWGALPCQVVSFNSAKQTIEAQPAVNGRQRLINGNWVYIAMPKLVDVPVCWMGGGGATWTFPIQPGDECLVVFSSRCIDAWYAQGFLAPNTQDNNGNPVNFGNNPTDFRMHDLSDGFALVGVRSQPRKFSTFDNSTARLRTDDDSCYVEFDPTNKKVNILANGGINMNGVTIDASGNLTSPATVTGQTQVVAKTGGSAVHLSTHIHGGVQTGGSNTAAPTAGS
jgi:hypothetical protein